MAFLSCPAVGAPRTVGAEVGDEVGALVRGLAFADGCRCGEVGARGLLEDALGISDCRAVDGVVLADTVELDGPEPAVGFGPLRPSSSTTAVRIPMPRRAMIARVAASTRCRRGWVALDSASEPVEGPAFEVVGACVPAVIAISCVL